MGAFEQILRDKINSMFLKSQYELVLNCLSHICMHYTPFIDRFFLRLFDIVPKLVGDLKQMALNLILVRAEAIKAAQMKMEEEENEQDQVEGMMGLTITYSSHDS